ncbi:MAG: hypothetical protein ACP5GU_01800 [Thermoprotei archaeon]|jgi:hypothetical protein
MSIQIYRCVNCNAPLDVTPETIVSICEYCGYPNWINTSAKTEIIIVPSRSRDDIIKAFLNRVDHDFDLSHIKNEISIRDVQGFYIPYWIVKIDTKAHYEGYKVEITTGAKGRIETRRVHTSGDFSFTKIYGLLARRAVEDLAVENLAQHYIESNTTNEVKLDQVDWSKIKLKVLSGEYDEKTAIIEAKERAFSEAKKKAQEKITELTRFICYTNINNSFKPKLILLPYWILTYSYKNSIFRFIASGWDAKPLETSEPVLIYRRIIYLLGIFSGIIISSLTASIVIHNPIIGILGIIFGSALTFKSSGMFMSDVRLERG